MDFLRANSLLEEAQEDLANGFLAEALEKLSSVVESRGDVPSHFDIRSIALPKSKKTPKTDKDEPGSEPPMRFMFKSLVKKSKDEGMFDRFIGGGGPASRQPKVSSEPRRGPGPIPDRNASKRSGGFQPAIVGYPDRRR